VASPWAPASVEASGTDASIADVASSLAVASNPPPNPSRWSDASPPPIDASFPLVDASFPNKDASFPNKAASFPAAPASMGGAIPSEPAVLVSATNPWLKWLTSPVATEPATVVATRSNPDPSLVDHTTTGVDDPPA
jgi:hypothetical protein